MRARTADRVAAAVALGSVLAGALEARRGTLRTSELRAFEVLNQLSGRAHVPVWVVMQLGSLGGALTAGAVLAGTGRPALGRRVALVATVAWTGSKVVKPFARRGRPASLVEARVLGRDQAGLGYPSGHAAVAAAAALAVAPHVDRRWWVPLGLGAAAVGSTRAYVGAHLPLDLAGGVALGVAAERAVRSVSGPA